MCKSKGRTKCIALHSVVQYNHGTKLGFRVHTRQTVCRAYFGNGNRLRIAAEIECVAVVIVVPVLCVNLAY